MVMYEENIVENKYDMLGFEVVYFVIGQVCCVVVICEVMLGWCYF